MHGEIPKAFKDMSPHSCSRSRPLVYRSAHAGRLPREGMFTSSLAYPISSLMSLETEKDSSSTFRCIWSDWDLHSRT